jgi:hypothetical protein
MQRTSHAIGNGDPTAAEEAVRRRLSRTLSELNALRERYPDYMLPIPAQGGRGTRA